VKIANVNEGVRCFTLLLLRLCQQISWQLMSAALLNLTSFRHCFNPHAISPFFPREQVILIERNSVYLYRRKKCCEGMEISREIFKIA
jgi:hypothetical protein